MIYIQIEDKMRKSQNRNQSGGSGGGPGDGPRAGGGEEEARAAVANTKEVETKEKIAIIEELRQEIASEVAYQRSQLIRMHRLSWSLLVQIDVCQEFQIVQVHSLSWIHFGQLQIRWQL